MFVMCHHNDLDPMSEYSSWFFPIWTYPHILWFFPCSRTIYIYAHTHIYSSFVPLALFSFSCFSFSVLLLWFRSYVYCSNKLGSTAITRINIGDESLFEFTLVSALPLLPSRIQIHEKKNATTDTIINSTSRGF